MSATWNCGLRWWCCSVVGVEAVVFPTPPTLPLLPVGLTLNLTSMHVFNPAQLPLDWFMIDSSYIWYPLDAIQFLHLGRMFGGSNATVIKIHDNHGWFGYLEYWNELGTTLECVAMVMTRRPRLFCASNRHFISSITDYSQSILSKNVNQPCLLRIPW